MHIINKILISASFLIFISIASAINCDEAQRNIMSVASQIRANHQSIASFDIYKQEDLINKDKAILKNNLYIESINLIRKKCFLLN